MASRDHILNEIRRTAAENNGAPLGWRRFYSETGLKDKDWLRYWPRWGDAVREAGYSPNEKVVAFSDELLIEKFIGFARELGRIPTIAEMNIKKRSDSEFPNAKSYRRFGPKSSFEQKVKTYCTARAGYDDIVAMCAAAPPQTKETRDTEVSAAEEIGFVYLLRSGRHYKIGKTNAAGRRERELAIQLPEKAKTIHVIRTDDPPGIEAYWHRRFEAKRKNGEWFDLGAADIAAFRRRKFM